MVLFFDNVMQIILNILKWSYGHDIEILHWKSHIMLKVKNTCKKSHIKK